jgi:hypothetical protein
MTARRVTSSVDALAMLDRLGGLLEQGLTEVEARLEKDGAIGFDVRELAVLVLKFAEVRRAFPATPQTEGKLDMSRLTLDELRQWKVLIQRARVDDSTSVDVPLLKQ